MERPSGETAAEIHASLFYEIVPLNVATQSFAPEPLAPSHEEGAKHYGAARLLTCQSRRAAAQPPPRQRGALLPAARRGARPPRGDRLPVLAPARASNTATTAASPPQRGPRGRPGGRRRGTVRTNRARLGLNCLPAQRVGLSRRQDPR